MPLFPISDSPCDFPEYHRHGRKGIGVAQPYSGTDYPLVAPSADVRHLLAEASLVYDPPHFYGDDQPFRPPFRLHWLYGLGCLEPEDPVPTFSESASLTEEERLESPAPWHAADLIIVDADNRIVYDSTVSGVVFSQRAWGPRLLVHHWRHSDNGDAILVTHTKWPDFGTPTPRDYPLYFFPEAAVLDERTVTALPRRLKSLTVNGYRIPAGSVEFVADYNMVLTHSTTVGVRPTTSIAFDATAGGGSGVYPGCEPAPLVIRKINNIRPTAAGDFYLASRGCYYVRQPTTIVQDSPRLSLPRIRQLPGSTPDDDLPAEDAGTSKEAAGWPVDDDPAYAHLQIGNDCEPCCSCEDIVSAAEYMNDLRDRYQAVGESLESTRDRHATNIDRWNLFRDCVRARPLRLATLPQRCPLLDVAAQICNNTLECWQNIQLILELELTSGTGSATPAAGYSFITGASTQPSRRSGATERYELGGAWPEFTADFPFVEPGQSASVRFRLKFEDCGESPVTVTTRLRGTRNGKAIPPIRTKVENPGTESASSDSNADVLIIEKITTLDCPFDDVFAPDWRECAC